MHKYFIPQMDQTDCGFACLKMLVATLYEDERALYIKQDEGHGPYAFKQIQDKGKVFGVELKGIAIEDKKEIKNIRFPFIALLKKKNEVFHYVLVTKVKYGLVYFCDPSEGESILSIKSFSSLWTSNALIIDDFEKKEDVEFIKYDIRKNDEKVLINVFQVLSAIFLIIGIYFVNDKVKIVVPLLFLLLSLVSEIVLRILLIKQIKKMDDEFLTGINLEKKRYFDFYERFEDYKKKAISSKMSVVFSFIAIIFIAIVTLLNNIYNAFLILVPLLLAIINSKFVEVAIREKDEVLSIEEREIYAIKNVDIFKEHIGKLHVRGYKIAKMLLINKCINIVLIVGVALLTTALNKTFSLPFLIFYSVIGYMLFEQYNNFLKYPECQKELLKSKVRLYNVIERI